MKKIVFIICLIVSAQTVFSQSTETEIQNWYEILKHAKTPEEQVTAWSNISESYGYLGKPDSCRYASEQVLRIATESNQDLLLCRAYLYLGNYFSNVSDYKQALEYEFKSLKLAEKLDSLFDIWIATKEIGVNFKELKNFDEALKYLLKASSIVQRLGSEGVSLSNRTYTHLSEIYLELGQPDSALRYIQIANENTDRKSDDYGYARVLYIFAIVHQAKGDHDLAESYFKKCLQFSDEKNVYSPFVTSATQYGKYLYETGNYQESKMYALRGYFKAVEAKDKLLIANAASLLRKVYYASGQKDSSYFYSEIKEAYTDSVFSEQQRNQIQNLTFSRQLKELEDQELLLEAEKQRSQNIQYALIAVSILVLLILYLMLSRSFITNTKLIEYFGVVALLIIFEFLNLLLHPFLEKITHHNPLLMLLSLVSIAALLVPMHHKIEKWATSKLIEKNKRIRLAAARKTIQQLDGGGKDVVD